MKTVDRNLVRQATPGRGVLAAAAMLAALAAGPAAAEDAKTIAGTVCVACHGDNGNSVIPMFPKIAGLSEQYIVKQLRDFMSGRRKSDVMGPIVSQLKPEDVAPLAAYYSSQKPTAGEADDKKAVSLGKLIFFDGNEDTGVPACVGCHQPQGAGHSVYPRIGGQHVPYVMQQLKNFATGDRANDPSRYMRVTAKRMSEEEIQSVAEYLVGLGAK
ncbi:MAG: c-type cytochrome [Rhodocyclaceae bacterium]|nr:c-type cytochrome [Rhodocyclaceae bacterium]